MEKLSSPKSFLYKIVFNWPAAIVLLTIGGLLLAMFAVFYIDFMSIKEINMVSFDGDDCQLKIPVRYIYSSKEMQHTTAVSFFNSNKWRYSVRQDSKNNEIWIQISRLGFGGFAAYAARYEITDPAVKKSLRELIAAREHRLTQP